MTAVAVIVGWLLLGLATARVVYVTQLAEWLFDGESDQLAVVLVTVLWPVVWVALLAAGATQGAYRLVTLPTRRERLERRRRLAAQEAERVAAQARELGLPTVEADR